MKSKIKENAILFTFTLTTIMWSVVFYLIFISHVDYSPVKISKKQTREIFNLTPQGWSFFTKNPRYNRLQIYRIEDNTLSDRVTFQNFSNQNLFGLRRQNRQILNEAFSSLKSIISIDSLWYSTKEEKFKLVQKIKNYYAMDKNYKEPLLCGQFLFEMYEPVPWAWS